MEYMMNRTILYNGNRQLGNTPEITGLVDDYVLMSCGSMLVASPNLVTVGETRGPHPRGLLACMHLLRKLIDLLWLKTLYVFGYWI